MSDVTQAQQALQPDTGLLAATAAGDRAAFTALYDRHVKTVYRYVLRRVGDSHHAEEITQDVFVIAFEKAGTIHLIGTSLLPWLLVTGHNLTLAHQRRLSRDRARLCELPEHLEDVTPTPETVVENVAMKAAIEAALADLNPVDRQVFDLCIERDYSYSTAARAMGVSHGTIRNRLSRLRLRLRQQLCELRGIQP